MATLIGERRRGTLPPVDTLQYHDPAMWPLPDRSYGRTTKNVPALIRRLQLALSQANTLSVFRGSG